MSFLPAVRREIDSREPNDPVRITLEYLLQRALGRQNAVPLSKIVADLRLQGLALTETGFQHTVLAQSRDGDYFIGSGRRGYFLIDTQYDAEKMRRFLRRAHQSRTAEPGQSQKTGPRGWLEYLNMHWLRHNLIVAIEDR